MKRAVAFVVVVVTCVCASCGDTNAGRLCEPGDPTFCGDGFQCLTFCDANSEPQSICTPAFGAEAPSTFTDEALIDGKPAFGALGNVKHVARDLRIEITGVKGVVLPLLEDVAGDLEVVGTDVECVAFPRLVTVGGHVHVDNNAHLAKTELDALTSVTSDFTFTGDVALHTLRAPALTSVGGCVDVDFAHGATCSAPPQLSGASCCASSSSTLIGGDAATCAHCP